MHHRNTLFLALVALSLSATPAALALTGAGTSTTAPVGGNDPGWANVGYFGNTTGSAIFLGSYSSGFWVLTAAHVGANDASIVGFGGNTYSVVAGSAVGFTTNLTLGGTATADLTLFRVNGDAALAALSNLTIASSAPQLGNNVTQIGYGGNWTGAYTPYTKTQGGTTISTFGVSDGTLGAYTSKIFQTSDNGTGVQAVAGDSGGAMFIKSAGVWRLAGLMQATGDDALGNHITQGIDLSAYRNQINAYITAVPEPSTYALMAGGAGLVAIGVRRRRRVR